MKLVILGGGESGVGAALLGRKLRYEVFLSDKGSLVEKYRQILEEHRIVYEEGGHSEERVLQADLVVKSPGIPDTVPLIVKLREQGTEVISEIEFAGRHTDAKMVCITGSNGKTTTTLLTYHILTQAGFDAGLAGNVGSSLAAQVADEAHRLYVVELSSFQLDGMYRFKPDVAVITNITPDHLDRYDYKFERYIDSKFHILNNMEQDGVFIYGYDCDVVREKAGMSAIIPEQVCFTYTGARVCMAFMEGDMLTINWNGIFFSICKNEIRIKGRHNIYNAMAAVLACMRIGVPEQDIKNGLRTFPQVEHRLETVLIRDGVTYINDSKATNVDSAWYALDSMTTPVVWIAGGVDKGNDYSVLLELVREKVKVLICMGTDNRKLVDTFSGICEVVDTHTLDAAVDAVLRFAESGDTVLLSPCCASFDLFNNYEHRGMLFKAAVRQRFDKES